MKVVVIDYGLANIRSVVNALSCFEIDVTVAETGDALAGADRIVLPGVGAFDAGMAGLRDRGHDEHLQRRVIESKTPFLGICLGFQFVFESSAEGVTSGLGWINGRVERFPSGENRLKVPHIGWSEVKTSPDARMFSGMSSLLDYYFVHSFYAPDEGQAQQVAVGRTEYGLSFVSALQHENIWAVQFHPEKSQSAGMKLIENFLLGW